MVHLSATSRRAVVLSTLAALCAAVIAASVTVHAPKARGALASDSRAVANITGATSSMWSCAGPLPVGDESALSTLELANSSHSRVRAEYSFTTDVDASATGWVTVTPGRVVVLRPPPVPRSGFGAANVVALGRGLSVVEVVHGPAGPDAAACARSTSTTSYLVAGDTRKNDNITLSLYDPGATPAVASVSVATSSGVQTPADLQGIPVGAQQLATYSIAQRVPFQSTLGITVRTSAGSVVVGGLSSVTVGHT
ncbi:MAG: DUF5719 family protein, partial [Acidimicrobiales bacterium]